MEFRVLGPLEVHDGAGAVPIRAAKQRALLLILVLHANEVVASEQLIDRLWGERPPDSAANVLQTYVSHLRRLLGRGSIVTRAPGYLIRLDPGQLDRDRFMALVADARASEEPAVALEKIREALGLWRGPPLQEFAFEEFAQAEIARLDELRLATIEERVELELRLGRHSDVVGELEGLAAAHPLRERVREQLMLALYRCGRQAEALQVYQDTRRLLVDELGIDPGRRLRELEHAILRQDPALEVRDVVEPVREPPSEPAPAEAPTPPRPDVRKTVTIVFSDIVESTRLTAELDPEVLRQLMSRYFEEMRAIVERHGGIVEKYIGDAIMAVFGVPVLHEDDALRAVRAAAEMQTALTALNEELDRLWGVRLGARIGVNTGEVVAGDHSQGHLFVTGEAVNVAKRLEEAAGSGEVLIGPATHEFVRDAVIVESTGERTLKHGRKATALRVVAVDPQATGHTRRFDSPLVGRDRQLEVLRTVFRSVVDDKACHLLTVLGAAGMGKSRLVQEFVATLDVEVLVLRGRCLPYGEGITYWPLAEVVRDHARATGDDPGEHSAAAIAARVAGEEKAELIGTHIVAAIGVGESGSTSEEIFWAVRKLFETLARQGPLVLVFDDIQWAEPTFLDLIEHVADFARDIPLLLVCVARPELLDQRHGWGGGKLNAASILLEPLSDSNCRQLIENLLDAPIPAEAESRIAEAAGGNALFAEELVALLVGDDPPTLADEPLLASAELADVPVPPTIHALLAARLEALPADERELLARASVEGTVFHRTALAELAPDLTDSTGLLMTLIRRDVIRPCPPGFVGDEAFRFRHILIRDAAYRSLPKTIRAELHTRFADWLERDAETRLGAFDEILGYHLEQAYRYWLELGALDAEAVGLAARGSALLESAGRRALARGDVPAAVGLLERAANLLGDDNLRRAALLPELGAALIEAGRLAKAEQVLDAGRRSAMAAGDECAESHALVQQQFLQLLRVEDGGSEDIEDVLSRVMPVFERHGDHRGLCKTWRLQAFVYWNAARASAAAEAWERAAAEARLAGDEHARAEIHTWIASSLCVGPTPVSDAIRRCGEICSEVRGNLEAEAATTRHLAALHAMEGRFPHARELLAKSDAIYADLGVTLNAAASFDEADVEMLAGDAVAAEKSLRRGFEALERMGEKAFLSTMAAFLARAILLQGRDDEAGQLAELSAQLAAAGDVLTQAKSRCVRARINAKQGRAEEAEARAREAVALVERTDFLASLAEARLDLAYVLQCAGRGDEASVEAAEALRLYEQKGCLVAVRKISGDLGVLSEV